MTIEIMPNVDDAGIATWLHGRLTATIENCPGDVAICLPGGSTPFPILERLAFMEFDWSRIVVWPGDDRCVPEDHVASNAGRLRSLLDPVGARLVPLAEQAEPPHFSLTWLGMGEDGHIASLFPNTGPQADDPLRVRRITPDPLPPEAPFDRLSLTIPALLDADEVLFVIRTPAKRMVFEQAMRGENDLPVARLLAAARQPVTCFT